ncbi:hypothetical protein L1987_77691 [Smallanthus sonchifolius]|uniref:Uncharacterized protein n=1 Tax=Smallanthus sonchifolius TaxID=185202 RepID=A0ACB8ZBL7_9ASTR|nr:hypothetical protein L1987_77691 [Smallanthus sonchifolius]
MTIQPTSSMAPWSPVAVQRSPWHSPVPYLFGGLAAMLALIAFALLILACSCWRIAPDGERDIESGNRNENGDSKPVNHKEPTVFEEKCLVIMAGQVNPTFLATPISSRASSFGSCSCRSNSTVSTDMSSVSEEEKQMSFENQENTHDQLP